MELERAYAVRAAKLISEIRSAFQEAGWSKSELARRLGWTGDPRSLYRYMTFRDELDRQAAKEPLIQPPFWLVLALSDLFNIDIRAGSGLPPIKAVPAVDCDPQYIEKQHHGRQFESRCKTWKRRIQEYFSHKEIPVRVVIAPTHEYSVTLAEKLTILGVYGALEVERALFKTGPVNQTHVILQGLGKHMNALVNAILRRHKARGRLIWLPAMGDDDRWDYFSANNFCDAMSHHLGGMQPVRLNTPSFVEFGDEEKLEEIHHDPSYQALFERPRVPLIQREYSAWDADTALLGCGVAAPGNPLYDSEKRQREPSRLRMGEYPAIGDLNGFYQCVARDGTLLVHDPNGKKPNPEAWDANRRAIGATPDILKAIADRYRKSRGKHGGGVIVLANTAARAPIVCTALHLGLINTLVMDFECAAALIPMLKNPQEIVRRVPERVEY
jgi:DNA-binding transcriptional regulator LsrR (DeoR family)